MRPRVPETSATIQAVAHFVVVLSSLLSIILLVYCSATYAKTLGWGFFSSSWTIVMSNYELAALVDTRRRFPRFSSPVLSTLYGLTMVLCTISVVTMLEDGSCWQCGDRFNPYPADPYRSIAAWFQFIVGVIYCFLMFWSCIEYYKKYANKHRIPEGTVPPV